MAPSWTVPVDEATGFVVGSPLWNQLLGASGDLQMLAAVAQDATLVDLVSSVTETDLIGTQGSGISIPGGTVQSASMLHIRLAADLLNNTGSNIHGVTFKLYWGGNAIAASLLNAVAATTRCQVFGEFFVIEEAATNQAGLFGIINSNANSGLYTLPAPNTTRAWSDFTVDGTVSQALRLTATLDTSSASLEFRKRTVTVQKVGNA